MKFKIYGDMVTQNARNLYWNDKKSFSEVKDYISGFIGNDVSEKIIISIIEGRQKLVGINAFSLEPDGINIRPITDRDNRIRDNENLRLIKEDMNRNIKKYIDFYACDKSWLFFRGFSPKDAYEYAYTDISDIAKLMMSSNVEMVSLDYKIYPSDKLDVSYYFDDSEKDILDHGAYMVFKPELINQLMGRPVNESNTGEFYEKIYEYWENSEYKNHPRIKERQKRYLRSKEKTNNPISNKLKVKEITIAPKKPFNSKYGIIDRQGNWYDCDWGKHALVALNIIENNKKQFGLDKEQKIDIYQALDMIVSRGYILIRDVFNNTPKLYYKGLMHPNSEQQRKIEEYKEYFQINELDYENVYYF